MGTPYTDIYDVFLGQIQDPIYAVLSPDDAENDMKRIMVSAVTRFEYPRFDLNDRDDDFGEFTDDLDGDTIQILAKLMKLEKTDREINTMKLIKQGFSDRDFKHTSQAEHLSTLLKLRQQTEEDCEKLKIRYSFKTDNKPNFSRLCGDE